MPLDMNNIPNLSTEEISALVESLYWGGTKHFASRANRDAVATAASKRFKVRKSSTHNQLMNPHYLVDSRETDKGIFSEKEWFSVVYNLSFVSDL